MFKMRVRDEQRSLTGNDDFGGVMDLPLFVLSDTHEVPRIVDLNIHDPQFHPVVVNLCPVLAGGYEVGDGVTLLIPHDAGRWSSYGLARQDYPVTFVHIDNVIRRRRERRRS